jgi:hypothetical protein
VPKKVRPTALREPLSKKAAQSTWHRLNRRDGACYRRESRNLNRSTNKLLRTGMHRTEYQQPQPHNQNAPRLIADQANAHSEEYGRSWQVEPAISSMPSIDGKALRSRQNRHNRRYLRQRCDKFLAAGQWADPCGIGSDSSKYVSDTCAITRCTISGGEDSQKRITLHLSRQLVSSAGVAAWILTPSSRRARTGARWSVPTASLVPSTYGSGRR